MPSRRSLLLAEAALLTLAGLPLLLFLLRSWF
jgi:hypothetical protein